MLSKIKSKTAKQILGESKTIKSVKAEPKYKDTLLNRLKEDWHQPYATPIYEPSGSPFKANTLTDKTNQAAGDKYPYGSLTGRGKTNKSGSLTGRGKTDKSKKSKKKK